MTGGGVAANGWMVCGGGVSFCEARAAAKEVGALNEEDGGEHGDGEEGGFAEGDVDGEAEEGGDPEAFEGEDGADTEEGGVGKVVGVPVVGGGAESDGDAEDEQQKDVGEPPGVERAATGPPEGDEHERGEREDADEETHELFRADGLEVEGADGDGAGVAGGEVAEGGVVAGPAEEGHKGGAALVGQRGVAEGVLAPVDEAVVDEEVGAGGLEGGEGEQKDDEPVAAAEGRGGGRNERRWGGGGPWAHTALRYSGPGAEGVRRQPGRSEKEARKEQVGRGCRGVWRWVRGSAVACGAGRRGGG